MYVSFNEAFQIKASADMSIHRAVFSIKEQTAHYNQEQLWWKSTHDATNLYALVVQQTQEVKRGKVNALLPIYNDFVARRPVKERHGLQSAWFPQHTELWWVQMRGLFREHVPRDHIVIKGRMVFWYERNQRLRLPLLDQLLLLLKHSSEGQLYIILLNMH